MADEIRRKIVFTVDSRALEKTGKKLDDLFGRVSKRRETINELFKQTQDAQRQQVRMQMKELGFSNKLYKLKQELSKLGAGEKDKEAALQKQIRATAQESIKSVKDLSTHVRGARDEIREKWGGTLGEIETRMKGIADQGVDLREGFNKMGFELKLDEGVMRTEDVLKNIMKDVAKMTDRSKEGVEEIIKTQVNAAKKASKRQEKLIKKQSKLLEHGSESAAAKYGEVLGIGIPESMKNFMKLKRATSARSQLGGEKMRAFGEKKAAAAKGLGGKGMGMLIQGIGSLVGKLGPLLGILGGLASFIKVLIDAEAQAKELNKTLLESGIAGQDLLKLSSSAQNADKAFDSLRSTYTEGWQENLMWMKTAKEQIGVMGELHQAGMDTTKISRQGSKAQREATDTLLTYSTLYGVSVGDIAKLTADFNLEYLKGTDSIKESLSLIGISAKSSGMSSNRFFATVQSLTSQMGLFNFSLEGTASLLSKVSSTSIFGAKAAEEALGSFSKKFSEDEFVMTVGLIQSGKGQEAFLSLLKSSLSETKKEVSRLEALEKSGRLSTEQEKELLKLQRTLTMQTAAVNGGIQEQIAYMTGPLAKQTDIIGSRLLGSLTPLAKAIPGIGGDINKLTVDQANTPEAMGLVAQRIEQMMNVSQEDAMIMRDALFKNAEGTDKMVDLISGPSLKAAMETVKSAKESAKRQEADLKAAQDLSRNTASVTTAIEIGVTYFLEKIYDIMRALAGFFLRDDDQKVLLSIEDQIARQREMMRETDRELIDQQKKAAFGDEKEREEAAVQIGILEAQKKDQKQGIKETIELRNATKVGIAKLREKFPDEDPSSELVRAAGQMILAGKGIDKLTKEQIVGTGQAHMRTEREEKLRGRGKGLDELRKMLASEQEAVGGNVPDFVRAQAQQRATALQTRISKQEQAKGITPTGAPSQFPSASTSSLFEMPAHDAFGITKPGFLPFPVSPGDIVVQKDNLVDAMKGAPGQALTAAGAPTPGAARGGRPVSVTININGGDLAAVRNTVHKALREYEDGQKV